MNAKPKKLIVHIGTGKAGSTSIQDSLASLNSVDAGVKPLRAFGFPNARLLAMATRNQQSRLYFVERYKVISTEDFDTNARKIWADARKEVARSDVTSFVASSEFIGAMIRGDDIKTLKNEISKIFDEIMILVYLRDQRSFLRSLWAQSVKGPSKSTDSFGEFIDNMEIISYSWNYSIFLRDWLHMFGEKLNVRMFDPRTLYNGDILADFYSHLGVKDLSSIKSSPSNISPSFEELEKIRRANFCKKNPSKIGGFPRSSRQLSRLEYEALVVEKVSLGNKFVNETFFKDSLVKLPTID